MAERLTTLAKRLRPFIAGQVQAIASGGGLMTEGPDIDIVGTAIGRGGDKVLLFDSGGNPVAEFAATGAGLVAALAAATSGDVVELPPQTITVVNPTFNLGVGGKSAYVVKSGVKMCGYGKSVTVIDASHTAGEADPCLIELQGIASEIEGIWVKVAFSGTTTALGISSAGLIRDIRITPSHDSGLLAPLVEACSASFAGQVLIDGLDISTTSSAGCTVTNGVIDSGADGVVRNITITGTNYLSGIGLTGLKLAENIYVSVTSEGGCTAIDSDVTLKNSIGIVTSSYAGSDAGVTIYGIDGSGLLISCYGQATSDHSAASIQTIGIYSQAFSLNCTGIGIDVSGYAAGIYFASGYGYNSAGIAAAVTGYDVYDAGASGLYSVGGTITHAAYDTQYYLKGDREKRGIRDNTPLTVGTYTLDYTYEVVECDASGGAIVLNLPAIATYKGQLYYITKRDSSANTVTITPNGSETINGQPTLVLGSQHDAAQVNVGSTEWMVL